MNDSSFNRGPHIRPLTELYSLIKGRSANKYAVRSLAANGVDDFCSGAGVRVGVGVEALCDVSINIPPRQSVVVPNRPRGSELVGTAHGPVSSITTPPVASKGIENVALVAHAAPEAVADKSKQGGHMIAPLRFVNPSLPPRAARMRVICPPCDQGDLYFAVEFKVVFAAPLDAAPDAPIKMGLRLYIDEGELRARYMLAPPELKLGLYCLSGEEAVLSVNGISLSKKDISTVHTIVASQPFPRMFMCRKRFPNHVLCAKWCHDQRKFELEHFNSNEIPYAVNTSKL